ncbi:MAG: ABC transporter permease, partial [archaeon]
MKQLPLFVINNLRRRKLRSWLTIIGIIVGVLAIVSLMSLSQGLKDSITSEFDKLGAQKITIDSKLNALGAETNKGLTTDDIREIKKISDIQDVVGKINSGLIIKYNGESKFLTVTGYDITQMTEIFKQDNVELLKGRLPESQKAKEIIMGYDFYVIDVTSNNTPNPMGFESSAFKKKIDIGSEVEIDNEKYKVVGILKDTGNTQTNRNCYMPIETLRKITGASETSVDSIYAIAKDGKDVEVVGETIKDKLIR